MEVATWVVLSVLGGLLLIGTTCSFVFSVVLLFSGLELQRCPHCHHYGIDLPRQLHVPSCPPRRFERHLPPNRGWGVKLHVLHH